MRRCEFSRQCCGFGQWTKGGEEFDGPSPPSSKLTSQTSATDRDHEEVEESYNSAFNCIYVDIYVTKFKFCTTLWQTRGM